METAPNRDSFSGIPKMQNPVLADKFGTTSSRYGGDNAEIRSVLSKGSYVGKSK